ncbi:MAG: GntR family transcriptional regulator [Bacillota bacterium]|nr:GntR family transcriptional regulator [Bacillota bacterium]
MTEKKDKFPLGAVLLDKLREKIISGEYKAGENLTEMKLANEYGISRTPIREALRKLEGEGLVEIIPNKGAVIVGLTDSEISDVYNIRMRIESMAAYLAAKNISDEQLERLREAHELFVFYVRNGNEGRISEIDFTFHDIIYEASKSRPLQSILHGLSCYIRCTRHETLKIEGRKEKAAREHEAILKAIEERNADLAEKLAYEHIINAASSNKACHTLPLGGRKLQEVKLNND